MNWRDFQHEQKLCEVHDRYLSYIDRGIGPAVVLLHGLPTWGYVWHAVMGEMSRGHRVLVPDLAGCGFSDHRDRFDRSITRQAQIMVAWMDELGVKTATLVGHDVGGGVALRMATLEPECARALVLVESVAYDNWPSESLVQLGHPEADRKLTAGVSASMLRQMIRGELEQQIPAHVLEGLVAPYSTEVAKLSMMRCAAACDPNQTMELVPRLGSIRVPTRVVLGGAGEELALAMGRRLAGDIPGAEVAVVEGARHYPMLEKPGETLRAMEPILARAAAPAKSTR